MPDYGANYGRSEAALISATGWFKQQNYRKIIGELQTVKFSFVEERQKVPGIINDQFNRPADDQIYDFDSRFPDKGFYISLQCDDVQQAIKALLLAAAYRSPDVSETNKDLTGKSASHASNITGSAKNRASQNNDDDKDSADVNITSLNERLRLEKATKSYYEAILSLDKAFKVCSLNQNTFETKYNLTWQ